VSDEGNWAVDGYDTFEGGPDAYYRVKDGLESEDEALMVAAGYMQDLERRQPTEPSGGQGPMGIQDQVFVVRPDGTRYRFRLQ
jgi:hypothetical protein